MDGSKAAWIVPIFVVVTLVVTIWIGILQFNSTEDAEAVNDRDVTVIPYTIP
jgi:hypothetical protein